MTPNQFEAITDAISAMNPEGDAVEIAVTTRGGHTYVGAWQPLMRGDVLRLEHPIHPPFFIDVRSIDVIIQSQT